VDTGSKKAFRRIEELWEILNNTEEKVKKNNEN
jgi:hypothetical protein